MKMLDDILNLLKAGGIVMYPLFIGSFVLWFSLIKRSFILFRGSKLSNPVLIKEIKNLEPKTLFLKLVHKFSYEQSSLEHEVLLIEAQEKLNHYKNLINSIVTTAPLLGLLGTVIGMIETFNSLGNNSLYTQSGGIAGGISQALITTQMGLAVAIPGLILGRMLNKKQVNLITDLDEISYMKRGSL